MTDQLTQREEAEKVVANLKGDHWQIAEYLIQRCGDYIYDHQRKALIAEFLRASLTAVSAEKEDLRAHNELLLITNGRVLLRLSNMAGLHAPTTLTDAMDRIEKALAEVSRRLAQVTDQLRNAEQELARQREINGDIEAASRGE